MTISKTEGEPLATGMEISESMLKVVLDDGRELAVPIEWFPRLRDATAKQRANWRFIGRGEGIHWPDIDEDISVAGLLRGRVIKRPRERAA
jgi:hypothetical protein